jgi:hypothetical protein
MAKKVVVTSRGLKLDMDALKRSQPNVKTLITGRKSAPKAAVVKSTINPVYKPRLHATIPSPLPKPVHEKVEVVKVAASKVVSKVSELASKVSELAKRETSIGSRVSAVENGKVIGEQG